MADIKLLTENSVNIRKDPDDPNGDSINGHLSVGVRESGSIGLYSMAQGLLNKASASYSHAEGNGNEASGSCSHAEGWNTIASGNIAHSSGENTIANVYCSTAIGRLSSPMGGPNNSYNGEADAFVIGNGTSTSTRSNAFRVQFDGKVYARSAFNATGADYAEWFEWADNNPNNNERIAYFVTLDGDKIRIANINDTYILGVISVNPSTVGNAYEDSWSGMYITDVYGRVQFHYVDVPASTMTTKVKNENGDYVDGEIEIPAHQEYLPVINPDYDPEQTYIPRSQRPEWDMVGMLGRLIVRDDGICEADGYCICGEGGGAVPAQSGWRVLKRINENHIMILFK